MYIKDKINQHLYNIYKKLEDCGDVFEFNPQSLIWDRRRFDLAIKFIYLTQKNKIKELNWHKELYFEHIKAFSNGTFKEGDSTKQNFEEYFNTYNKLEESFITKSFDNNATIIPFKDGINVDGSHRISLAAYYSQTLKGVVLPQLKAPNYDYSFFRDKKQPEWINDFVFLQNIIANNDLRIIHIHPKAKIKHKEILDILLKFGITPEYHKSIFLKKFAHGLIVRELYKDEKWIGNYANKFSSAFNHSNQSYTKHKPLTLYFIKETNLDKLREIKTTIREVCKIGNYSVHINDTYKETIELAKLYLNSQTIHFLNSCFDTKTFWKTDEMITNLQLKHNLNELPEYVLTGSMPLSLIGLRENRDVDFICDENDIVLIKNVFKDADCHNSYIKQFGFKINDTIYHPKQTFYWKGIKFLSLKNVWNLKKQRKERKDYIDQYLNFYLNFFLFDTNNIYKKLHNLKINPKVVGRKILGDNLFEKIKKVVKNS